MNARRFFTYISLMAIALAVLCDSQDVNQEIARACEAEYMRHGNPTVFINCMRPWLGFGELPDDIHAEEAAVCVLPESTNPLLEPIRECCFGEVPAPTGPARVIVTCGPRNRCKSVNETCKNEDCVNKTCHVRREDDVGECQKFATLFEMCWAVEECTCEAISPVAANIAVADAPGATDAPDVTDVPDVTDASDTTDAPDAPVTVSVFSDLEVTPKSASSCCGHFDVSFWQCFTMRELGTCSN